MSEKAIGVFDSGIGGMTVVKELFAAAPNERIVYFGDTARVPYGTKSVETIARYAREDAELLLAQDVKAIVVACNTVSAIALDAVRSMAGDIPVIGMIGATAREAVEVSTTGIIGIIGTQATISSNAYELALQQVAAERGHPIQTVSAACPLFVPLAEEGWTEHAATRLVAEEYLAEMKRQRVDTLILGCTHYPVLTALIQDVMGPAVRLLNSGAIAASEVQSRVPATLKSEAPSHVVLVSDVPRKFQEIGERFLGRPLPTVRQVQWKEAWVIRRDAVLP